jgi:hypothetical protein
MSFLILVSSCYIVEVGELFECFALELVWICDLMMPNDLG